mmetsp:Transcript_44802/g.104630  ORF Transcript_44802/g.104630 Transcript_44802/m.104630 type:complete len:200 (+) Transcript_44802:518-1117(+)
MPETVPVYVGCLRAIQLVIAVPARQPSWAVPQGLCGCCPESVQQGIDSIVRCLCCNSRGRHRSPGVDTSCSTQEKAQSEFREAPKAKGSGQSDLAVENARDFLTKKGSRISFGSRGAHEASAAATRRRIAISRPESSRLLDISQQHVCQGDDGRIGAERRWGGSPCCPPLPLSRRSRDSQQTAEPRARVSLLPGLGRPL